MRPKAHYDDRRERAARPLFALGLVCAVFGAYAVAWPDGDSGFVASPGPALDRLAPLILAAGVVMTIAGLVLHLRKGRSRDTAHPQREPRR